LAVDGEATDRERLVVASERLVDRGALRVDVQVVAAKGGRSVEIGQGRREPMEMASCSRARHEGPGVAGHLAGQFVRQGRGPLGVGNAAQHVSPQGDQLDQFGLLADGELFACRS
jgi:hypothetical protein